MDNTDQPIEQKTPKPTGALPEIAKTLKEASNVLVIISRDPSIDQLAASIGLTLALGKSDKHATAVYSGQTPPIIEFLEPNKTLEKNTDSLRDFIISLDKSKADKLRYKVEDQVVKIFITPYRTSISDKDLEFSQGDFNVDVIVALGVQNKGDLDEAIVAHGRILHDATIIAVSNSDTSELGSVQWLDKGASSLSEMVTDLVSSMDKELLDSQTATALLTGVIYETDRFRNAKAAPHTMSVSALLMEAGASTQLVAEKLEEKHEADVSNDNNNGEEPQDSVEIPDVDEDSSESEHQEEQKDPGLIEIEHDDDQIHIDDAGKLRQIDDVLANNALLTPVEAPSSTGLPQPNDMVSEEDKTAVSGSGMVFEPPKFGGQLTANTTQVDQQYISNPDPLTAGPSEPGATLNHTPQTISELEQSVNSPHLSQYSESSSHASGQGRVIQPLSGGAAHPLIVDAPSIDYAQTAVERAVTGSTDYRPEPIQALNAQPFGNGLNNPDPVVAPDLPSSVTPPPPVPPPMTNL